MDREILIKMLGALPDQALLKAFSVVGLAPQGGMGGDDLMGAMAAPEDSKIQGWKERKVPYGGGRDRPPISDKTWADMTVKPQAQQMARGGALGGDMNPFLQTGGM